MDGPRTFQQLFMQTLKNFVTSVGLSLSMIELKSTEPLNSVA